MHSNEQKIDVFPFLYNVLINREGGELNILEYNSPYPIYRDRQSLDDIKFAVMEQKVIKFNDLQEGKRYRVKMECRFIDKQTHYDQFFTLISISEE